MVDWSLYTAPEDKIDGVLVKSFIDGQREANLMTESMTLELKERRHGDNVARAVAGFANSDGGIILVGVAETNPTFEEAPGVPPTEVVGISDSCRNLLTPLVHPDILPVALPGRDTVIIVVRVDSDPTLQPVCKAGTVWVRAPGHTVAASREQIIALATGSQRFDTHSVPMPTLNSAFIPNYDHEQETTRDALIRVAGGVWLRPSAREFVFGTQIRERLRSILENTPFFLHPALDHVSWRRPEARPRCAEGPFTSTTASFTVEYEDNALVNRAAANFRIDGSRISYALDYEVRVHPAEARSADPSLTRAELVFALLVGIETAGLLLPDEIATLAESAPQRLDEIHVWAQNSSRSFDALLGRVGKDRHLAQMSAAARVIPAR